MTVQCTMPQRKGVDAMTVEGIFTPMYVVCKPHRLTGQSDQ